ncbi:MAG: class I SAM-dependent methyltransferase [Deltaproteobacteria bacterium]|nr:class I SAM-dependent methyltransferase [Deltaproteobacteria bacterium]
MHKPKLLLIAYRAFGDWIYSVPILPFLFDRYEVHLECNLKVFSLAYDDKRFSGITVFDDAKYLKRVKTEQDFDKDKYIQEHLQSVYDVVLPDRVVNLSFSHENKTIASREQEEFFASIEARRGKFGHWDYYNSVFDHVGIEKPDNLNLDTMWFTDEQIGYCERWRKRHTSDFLVVIPIMGSCMQKFYPRMNDVINHIVDTYHNAYVYIMGETGITEGTFGHDRIYDMTGKLSIKQSVLMTKYADYVIGPETGLVVGAGMFGTPKTMLCNTTAVKQVVGSHKNDYSLQSSWKCSPCHRGIYVKEDCDDITSQDGAEYSACVNGFKLEDICEIIGKVYNEKNIYNSNYLDKYIERGKSDLGRKIYEARWELVEKYCHGNKTLLDYGCAAGDFLSCKRNGFIADGYDINPFSQYHAKPKAERFDILTMWDVIEHLHSPEQPIVKYSPEFVFLSTPNLHDDVHFEDWLHNRPNEHLHYFNEVRLTELLKGLGYKILDMNFAEGEIRNPEKSKDIISVVAQKI